MEAAAAELSHFELDAEEDASASLRTAARTSSAAAALVGRLDALASRARAMAMAMDFRLVYEPQRRLFAIGYDARSGTLDDSVYDLLASESRLASFVAVAKDDAAAEHWFRLGRSLTVADGATALVSWSGTMFEYLMPLLVMPPRPFSLLDQTCHAAVHRQIAYARARGVPWGISESAYNVRDRHDTYQYRAFGVPDLALKRGLASDLVVAPYATALALAVDAHEALRNLAELERRGALGAYGFYDALDYTRVNPDERVAIVRTFMAHHVGMSLVALDNALSIGEGEAEGIWQRRFMADAAVRATALLLDERIPRRYVPRPPQSDAPVAVVEAAAPDANRRARSRHAAHAGTARRAARRQRVQRAAHEYGQRLQSSERHRRAALARRRDAGRHRPVDLRQGSHGGRALVRGVPTGARHAGRRIARRSRPIASSSRDATVPSRREPRSWSSPASRRRSGV